MSDCNAAQASGGSSDALETRNKTPKVSQTPEASVMLLPVSSASLQNGFEQQRIFPAPPHSWKKRELLPLVRHSLQLNNA